jgi:streptogramin lyase
MSARLVLGLILFPALVLAAAANVKVTFTATVNGAPNQQVVITGTYDTAEVVSGSSGGVSGYLAVVHNGQITIEGVPASSPFPLCVTIDRSGAITVAIGSIALFPILSTVANANTQTANLQSPLDVTIAAGKTTGLSVPTRGGGSVTITKVTSQITIEVAVAGAPEVTKLATPADAYTGAPAANGTFVGLVPEGYFSADSHGFAVVNGSLPNTYGLAVVSNTGSIAVVSSNDITNITPSGALTTMIPSFNPIAVAQGPGGIVGANNITVNNTPVTQFGLWSVTETGSLSPPTSLFTVSPQLPYTTITPTGNDKFVYTDTDGNIIYLSIANPGGPQSQTIQTSSQTTIHTGFSVTGLGVAPFGLLATLENSIPPYNADAGYFAQGQFHSFGKLVFDPGNPVYVACGNTVFNDQGGIVYMANPDTNTVTTVENFSSEAGIFQIFTAGPYVMAILTDGTVQLIDLNLSVPCFDMYPMTVSGPVGLRPRAVLRTASVAPSGAIVMGPDGAMWFADPPANAVGRLTGGGAVDSFPTVSPSSSPQGIAIGSDGNYWITETAADKIQQTTTQGVSTEFGGLSDNSAPANIIAGPDGALWFNESATGKMGRITTAGVVTEFATNGANSIAAGPDGAVWYTETGVAKIGRIDTSGAISECALPNVATQIAAGPDGAMWFTEAAANQIGRLTTDGNCTLTEYNTGLTASAGLDAITLGPDGFLWFTEDTAKQLGRIDPFFQAIAEYALPSGLASTAFGGIAIGVEGGVWIAGNAGEIVRLLVPAGVVASQITVGTNPPEQAFTFDGTSFTSAQTFSAPIGLSHTASVTVPAAGNGTRVVFSGWSDGAATASDTFTGGPVPSMHIANLETQYQLTTAGSPAAGGSVTATPSSPDGYYNAGTAVQITPVANTGYKFKGWSGDFTGSVAPANVTMSAPHSVTANFVSACVLTNDASPSVADVQSMVNEALGIVAATDDLNGDGVVNVVDAQLVLNAAINLGCEGKSARFFRFPA